MGKILVKVSSLVTVQTFKQLTLTWTFNLLRRDWESHPRETTTMALASHAGYIAVTKEIEGKIREQSGPKRLVD